MICVQADGHNEACAKPVFAGQNVAENQSADITDEVLSGRVPANAPGDLVPATDYEILVALKGKDLVPGGDGDDALFRGAGRDSVDLMEPAPTGQARVITDLAPRNLICLAGAAFGLVRGVLTGSRRGSLATLSATRILHDAATGAVLNDADGPGGQAAVRLASVTAGLTKGARDFLVLQIVALAV